MEKLFFLIGGGPTLFFVLRLEKYLVDEYNNDSS